MSLFRFCPDSRGFGNTQAKKFETSTIGKIELYIRNKNISQQSYTVNIFDFRFVIMIFYKSDSNFKNLIILMSGILCHFFNFSSGWKCTGM